MSIATDEQALDLAIRIIKAQGHVISAYRSGRNYLSESVFKTLGRQDELENYLKNRKGVNI
ncbi:MAG: hypothetical protein SOI13_01420 [Bifidobacterium mongoliense]|jgi:hypothetical protein|uniref:hypothetical protein n=1 Tax=Bifidobacterium mongoliense TaxID=518643 RepID=UPI002F35065C